MNAGSAGPAATPQLVGVDPQIHLIAGPHHVAQVEEVVADERTQVVGHLIADVGAKIRRHREAMRWKLPLLLGSASSPCGDATPLVTRRSEDVHGARSTSPNAIFVLRSSDQRLRRHSDSKPI